MSKKLPARPCGQSQRAGTGQEERRQGTGPEGQGKAPDLIVRVDAGRGVSETVRCVFGTLSLQVEAHCRPQEPPSESREERGRREISEAESTGYGDETGVGHDRVGGPWRRYPAFRTTGREGCTHVSLRPIAGKWLPFFNKYVALKKEGGLSDYCQLKET